MASGGMVNVDDQSPVSQYVPNSFETMFNSSGWTVATSGSKAAGAAGLPSWVLPAAAVGVFLYFFWRRGK